MDDTIKIAELKAILEKLESEGHAEVKLVLTHYEYYSDGLPLVDYEKDGKPRLFFGEQS